MVLIQFREEAPLWIQLSPLVAAGRFRPVLVVPVVPVPVAVVQLLAQNLVALVQAVRAIMVDPLFKVPELMVVAVAVALVVMVETRMVARKIDSEEMVALEERLQ